MSTTEAHAAGRDSSVGKVDMKLEVHVIPVSDPDRSKQFCVGGRRRGGVIYETYLVA